MILTKSKISEIDLDFEINNKIRNGKLDELLLIVPTNRKIRYLIIYKINYSKRTDLLFFC